MAERLTPGVYVEEVQGTVKPIQGVGTSTAAFIGEAPRGIPDRAQFVNGFRDFERRFGGHRRGEAGFLAQAVDAFFSAGGRRAYVVRVLPADASAGRSGPVQARAEDPWGIQRNVLQFEAKGNGAWAEHLRIHIEPSTAFPAAAFRVRVEWTEAGRSRTVETFDNVRMDPEHEDYVVRVVNETSQYLRAVDLFEAEFLDLAERERPPIPERVPLLLSQADDEYRVPIGAKLQFAWRDLASGLGTDLEDPPTVTFEEAVVEAADGEVERSGQSSVAVLTAAQLQSLLATELGDEFRVTAPEDEDTVRVEPAVASRCYLELSLRDGRDTFALEDVDTVRVTAAHGDGSDEEQYDVDVTDVGADGLTPRALAQRIAGMVSGTDDPYGIAVDDAGRFVTLTTRPSSDGATLEIEALGAPANTLAPWSDPRTSGGTGGLEVAAQQGVELTVSELIQLGVNRFLSQVFPVVRASGLSENQQSNPDLRPLETGDAPLRLLGGGDGSGLVGAAQYRGTVTDLGRTGLHAFDTVDVNMLVIPGKNTPDFLSIAMAYCDQRDMFFIADGIGSTDLDFEISADEVRRSVEGLPARSNNAAMFYPWVEVPDPVGVGRNPRRIVPPSGHLAGVFARTDVRRGVWKAPAGIEAVVSGAVDIQHHLVDADQDLLNPIGLNCIRQFPNVGIVSWGSRTLSSDPEWRYVPVRRTALFLKESLRRGLQWAVFEPNDQDLWDRVRINISAFMLSLFRQGAFQGATPSEAFLVKCDRETNPQELIDQGVVTAQVAFAPLKPAEFVVIEISQKSLLAV
jgi:phage tail sheath protein FI